MNIDEAVTTDYVEHDVKTPVSKLRGSFDNQDVRVVVITNGGEFEGVVSQKELLASHHPPEETAMSVLRHPPKVQRTEDVRETARLMVENGLRLVPVFEGERFAGVVTAEGLLGMVRENLDALDVGDVYTRDLIAVESDTTLGEVINRLRENRISRVPVVDDGDPTGMISVYDMVDFVVRKMTQQQGGGTDGFDAHGGEGAHHKFRSRGGGFGDRSGDDARMLDLPARDVMSTPAETTTVDEPLGDAVERMLSEGYSSLVVTDDGGEVGGIVTKTDALRSLTWTDEERIPVQVFNVDLLDGIAREDIARRVEEVDAKYEAMDILEANVVFHEHEERQRGVPLILATVRLFTDEGRFSGSGEEYGTAAAFRAAADTLEGNVLQDKSRGMNTHNRKDSPEKRQERERLLGWWLEGR